MLFEPGTMVTNKVTGETYPIHTYSFRQAGRVAIRVINKNGKITDWTLSSNLVGENGKPLKIPVEHCDEYEYYHDYKIGDVCNVKRYGNMYISGIYRLNTTGHVIVQYSKPKSNLYLYKVIDKNVNKNRTRKHIIDQVEIKPGMIVRNNHNKKHGRVIRIERINNTLVAKVKTPKGTCTNWSTVNIIPIRPPKKRIKTSKAETVKVEVEFEPEVKMPKFEPYKFKFDNKKTKKTIGNMIDEFVNSVRDLIGI